MKAPIIITQHYSVPQGNRVHQGLDSPPYTKAKPSLVYSSISTNPSSVGSGCWPRVRRPFCILFVALSAVLGLTISVLYWNYYENQHRIITKRMDIILDHWGKGGLSPKERKMIRSSLFHLRKVHGLAKNKWTDSYFSKESEYSEYDKEYDSEYPEGFFRNVALKETKMEQKSGITVK